MSLSYRCFGSAGKPALVLLHGFLGSAADWSALMPLLIDDFFLIAIDLPGHGASQWEEQDDCGCEYFCHRLEQTMQAVALDHKLNSHFRFNVLGYSLGGRLAMVYASAYGDRIERLFLEGAHPGLVSEQARQERYQSDLHWASRFAGEPLTQVLHDWYQQSVFADLTGQQVAALIDQRTGVNGLLLAKAMMAFSLSKQPDYRRNLVRLRAEKQLHIHYLHGSRDHKFAQLGQQLLAESAVDTVDSISQCGHNVHRQQPGAMAQLLCVLSGVSYE